MQLSFVAGASTVIAQVYIYQCYARMDSILVKTAIDYKVKIICSLLTDVSRRYIEETTNHHEMQALTTK